MSRNKLYTILSATCLMGYSWLVLSCHRGISTHDAGVCIFKQVTTIPCPSCGSTRSIMALIHGDIFRSIILNPLGIVLAMGLLTLPVWISYDIVTRRSSLLQAYHKGEAFINHKWIAIPAIALVLLNWIWNISKGL